MGQRPRTAAAVSARCHADVHARAAVLDRQAGDQDDWHAGMGSVDVRPRDLERRRLARGRAEAVATDLCAMAVGAALRGTQWPAISSTFAHSSSRTGAT